VNPAPRQSQTLKLEINVPTELALHHTQPVNVAGQYGPQMLFTLTGNRRLYVPPEAGEEIKALSLAPGQPFIITKVKGENQQRIHWVIERKPIPQIVPPPMADGSPSTQIEHALKTAIAAACSAEMFATEIGYTVRFSEESIKSLACTVLIQMERAA